MKNKVMNWFIETFPSHAQAMMMADHNYDDENKSPYHAEGDVWTHTEMVMDAYGGDDVVTIFAILCHDIGKPEAMVVDHENKKVSFKGHAELGVKHAYPVLCEAQKAGFELSDEDILNILIMVNNHLRIYQVKKESKIADIANAFSDKKYLDKFVDLAIADNKGRISDGKKKTLENKDDLYRLFKPRDSILTDKEFVMLVGCAGSGKTTWTDNNPEYKSFSFDAERLQHYIDSTDEPLPVDQITLYNNAYEATKDIVSIYDDCVKNAIKSEQKLKVIDNINISRRRRAAFLNSVEEGVKKVAYVWIPDKNRLSQRNRDRKEKRLPLMAINRQIDGFVMPDYSEFDEIHIVRW